MRFASGSSRVFNVSMNGEPTNRRVLCDIARAAFEVVNRLLDRDQLLAQQLRTDITTSRQIYREECITVEMATTLRERFPNNVEITLFTSSEERGTGADWYWRFERGDGAIHARVQAKRVRRLEFGQADRDGNVEINLAQLNDLIQATEEALPEFPGLQAWLATFARSDATPPCGQRELSRCRRHGHETACTSHEPSLWIAQAGEIRRLEEQNPRVQRIVTHSVRLDCILPCIDGHDANQGPASKDFTLTPGLPSYQDCIERI